MTGLSKPRTYLFLKNDDTSNNLHVEGREVNWCKVNWSSLSQDRKREAKHNIFSYLSTRGIAEYIYTMDEDKERKRLFW